MREQHDAILGSVESAGGWNGMELQEAGERSGKTFEVAVCAYWRLSRDTCYLFCWTSSGCWFTRRSCTDSLRRMVPSGTPFAIILGLAETFRWRLINITLDS